MGKGAFINIVNRTNDTMYVSYDGIDDVDPDQLVPVSGKVGAGVSLPAAPNNYQYIEATGVTARFWMVIETEDANGQRVELGRIEFREDGNTWWANNPYVRVPNDDVEFLAVVMPGDVRLDFPHVAKGQPIPTEDQFLMKVLIRAACQPERWMGQVKAEIADTELCELPIPGAHDAISYGMSNINYGSTNQFFDVTQQLENGVRYFDFRVQQQNDVFYGVHGSATTDHDYGVYGSATGNQPYVFALIKEFLERPTSGDELVILCFSHFSDFEPSDCRHFMECIADAFGDLLVPTTVGSSPTYTEARGTGATPHQVMVLINDTGSDAGLAQYWFDPFRAGIDDLFWKTSDCWDDHYSDLAYRAGADTDKVVIETLDNQQWYLTNNPSGHRRSNRFWVTQPIMNCDAAVGYETWPVTWWAANVASPLATFVYEGWWHNGQNAIFYPGNLQYSVRTPNIVIFDYAGQLDGFASACYRMLKGIT